MTTETELLALLKRDSLQKNVQLLLASEGGSRAWGFASETSDYDVKFLYRHNATDSYLALDEPEQHFSLKDETVNAEYSGWDVKKFLGLVRKGNAQVYELVATPRYWNDDLLTEKVFSGMAFSHFVFNACREKTYEVAQHYRGLAQKTYMDRVHNVGEVTLKKYFYILRPLLCVEQMYEEQRLPTLNFLKLLDETQFYVPKDVQSTTLELLARKREGNLTTADKSDFPVLNSWVEARLEYWKEMFQKESTKQTFSFYGSSNDLTNTANLDKVFRTLVNN